MLRRFQRILSIKICIPHMLENAAKCYPYNVALIFQGYFLNYLDLKDMVDRFATCLADFGVRKGDRVAVLLPNCIHTVVTYYAIMRLGAVAVMNNPCILIGNLNTNLMIPVPKCWFA